MPTRPIERVRRPIDKAPPATRANKSLLHRDPILTEETQLRHSRHAVVAVGKLNDHLKRTVNGTDSLRYRVGISIAAPAESRADLTDGAKSMPGLAFPFQLHIGERPERGPRHILRLPP